MKQLFKKGLLGSCLIFGGFSAQGQDFSEKSLLDIFLPGQIKKKEEANFYPSFGYHDAAKGEWNLFVSGRLYEPEDSALIRLGVQTSYEAFTGDVVVDTEDFWNRAKEFFNKAVSGRSLNVKIGGESFRINSTNGSGFWHDKITLTERQVANAERQGEWLIYSVNSKDGREFKGYIKLIEDGGLSVISDVDDTIKVTENSAGAVRVLQNSFNRPFKVTPGISELYKALAERDAEFHYLTAGPWQLHDFLFVSLKFKQLPVGSFFMRDFNLDPFSYDFYSLLTSSNTEEYKKEQVAKIIRSFPNREFILIGDSSQKDPEVYGWATRRFPGQVREVYIRNVTNETKGNSRMRQAFGNSIDQLKFIRPENGELH